MFHLQVILQVVDLAVDLHLVEVSVDEGDEVDDEEVVGRKKKSIKKVILSKAKGPIRVRMDSSVATLFQNNGLKNEENYKKI